MPLGSAPTSRIDIDYIRAQGKASTGRILFQPPRQPLDSTMLSNAAVAVDLYGGVGSVELVRLPAGTYKAIEQIDGLPQRSFDFALPLTAPAVLKYEDIVQVTPIPARFTYVAKINGILPDPTTGNITLESLEGPMGPQGEKGDKGDKGDPGDDGIDGTNGLDGENGPKGDKGDPGDDGSDGAPGTPGADGEDASELYPPSEAGYKAWTADPQVCSGDF